MSISLERIKVLVVDDNRHMINIAKTILKGFGVSEIFDATGGARALQLAARHTFDLIVTDCVMSPIDGLQLTRHLRADAGGLNRFVPIIMLSAATERSQIEAARDAGVTEFCAKPVSPAELYRKLAMVVNYPRPYVRANDYVGPDRRRRKIDQPDRLERRTSRPPSL